MDVNGPPVPLLADKPPRDVGAFDDEYASREVDAITEEPTDDDPSEASVVLHSEVCVVLDEVCVEFNEVCVVYEEVRTAEGCVAVACEGCVLFNEVWVEPCELTGSWLSLDPVGLPGVTGAEPEIYKNIKKINNITTHGNISTDKETEGNLKLHLEER